jgi:rhodanese-related sulfurtransferase
MAESARRRTQVNRRPVSSFSLSDLGGILLGALGIVAASAALGIAVNQCSPRGIPLLPSATDEATAPSLPAGIVGMNLEEAQAAFEAQSVLFLDARTPEEYAEGHVPGALNLPTYEFEEHFPDLADLVEDAPSVVVYCEGMECSDSIEVAERLLEVGCEGVHVFEPGWRAWKDSGGPVNEGLDP